MLSSPTVVVRELEKTYLLTSEGEEIGFAPKQRRIVVHALKPISFVASSGESIGVLGKNGSGKSTLMSLLAGNIEPTSGSIIVSKQPTLLSVSAALQKHLSGLQNVRLGLLAKGLSLQQAKSIEGEVAKWADIGEAVHRPLKTYSSGMKSRLRFAIATAVRPEILLVDEALATGDASFNAKARERMDSFLDDAATVFIVSHSTNEIRNQCTRALWLHEGELIADGPAEDIATLYHEWSTLSPKKGKADVREEMLREVKQGFVPDRIILDSEAAKLLDATDL